MSNEKSSVDELAEQVGELSGAERAELLESVQSDLLERYLEVRGEFMKHLGERGLLGTYPEDSPWAAYCRDHPEDPICLRILSQEGATERQREYLDARRTYVERLREEGLLSAETDGGAPGHAGTAFALPIPGPTGITGPGRLPTPFFDICDYDPCFCNPYTCECNPHLPWCYDICDRYPCLCNPCSPGCPEYFSCQCNDWPWCRWRNIPEFELPPRGLTVPTAMSRGGMGLGGTAATSRPMMSRGGLPAGLTPMPQGPVPGPIPGGPTPGPIPWPVPEGPITGPVLDICARYPCLCNRYSCECNPWLPWCVDPHPCLLRPFSCECNPDLPWCDPWWGLPDPRDLGSGPSRPRPAPGFGGMTTPGGTTPSSGYPMRSMGAYFHGY
ncbi:hypothetical protein [Salinigranum sp. GCM10025319]|uniref:hypothetical protein n=1 Tax=Salinigranum sp. GCM10025319 TaxID=3252687 RepID=UPI003609164E